MQVAVQIEAGVVFPAGDDQALVGGVALIDDGVAVVALFGESGDAVRGEEGDGERGEDEPGAQAQCGVTRQLVAEDAGGEQATAAFRMPKSSAERAMPRRGASKSGKRSETASAPR